jgi:hypothetical protein
MAEHDGIPMKTVEYFILTPCYRERERGREERMKKESKRLSE